MVGNDSGSTLLSPDSVTCTGHCLSTAAEVSSVCRDPVLSLHAVRVGDSGSVPLQGGFY